MNFWDIFFSKYILWFVDSYLDKVQIFWDSHKNCANLPLFIWHYLVASNRWKMRKHFVVFSEYLNFKYIWIQDRNWPIPPLSWLLTFKIVGILLGCSTCNLLRYKIEEWKSKCLLQIYDWINPNQSCWNWHHVVKKSYISKLTSTCMVEYRNV